MSTELDISQLTPESLTGLTDEQLEDLLRESMDVVDEHRKVMALESYQSASARAMKVHEATETIVGVGGGNRSSKTETTLVEAAIMATGVIPESLKGHYPKSKLRGPCNIRICCESLTTTLHPVILYKLYWRKWSGQPPQGGPRGHWGWIPQSCLVDGDWQKSWSEKLRTLTVYYRNPDDINEVMGESYIQFMSYDQDPSDYASGEFHLVLHDEPPPYAIYRENRARIMSVNGRITIAMTWPDDPAIAVDWLFDEVYEKGQEGPNRDPNIRWLNLVTTENPNLDQASVAREASQMSKLERQTRIEGKPIRFSNRIHPIFTDIPAVWCFTCGEETYLDEMRRCFGCKGTHVTPYCHAQEFELPPSWPVVEILDPHPRKPHMICWVAIDGNDDLYVVAELQLADEPLVLREAVDEVERMYRLNPVRRIMDPNMGASPASTKRGVTWQNEFDAAGLPHDLAIDSDVGRSRVNEYLKPDPNTGRPRLVFHETRVPFAMQQMKRYTWDDHRMNRELDQKQKPKPKHDDYPTMLKYLLNEQPTYSTLKMGPVIIRHQPGRCNGY